MQFIMSGGAVAPASINYGAASAPPAPRPAGP
jgi:hypothetical protein